MNIPLYLLLPLLAVAGGFVFYMLLPKVTHPLFPIKLQRKLSALALWWKVRTRYGTELGGFVHDDGHVQWISPLQVFGDTAAWTFGAGQVSNSLVYKCDATDEVANLFIPILIPSNSGVDTFGNAVKGAYFKYIEVDFEILIAALDVLTPVIYKMKRGADGADVVVSTPAFSYDAGHDTAAERIDVDEHKMRLTLDSPAFIEDDEYYWLKLPFDKAATSTVEFLGAFVGYTYKA